MKTTHRTMAVIFLGLLLAWDPANAQEAEQADRVALRELRGTLVDAITRGDSESVLKHVHPNVVVTWQNNEVCRGRKGLSDFFAKSTKQTFQAYKTPPTPDEPTILFGGDTGVAFGETVAEYQLLGRKLEMKSRWTATAVKEEGRWMLAAYHVSMNVLDNPVLGAAKGSLYGAGAGALVAGLLGGMWLGKRRKRSVVPVTNATP